MIANYSRVRKSYKWTNKVFFHFIEEAVFNAFLLLKKTGSVKRFMDTKLELLKAIIAETDAKIDEIVPSIPWMSFSRIHSSDGQDVYIYTVGCPG